MNLKFSRLISLSFKYFVPMIAIALTIGGCGGGEDGDAAVQPWVTRGLESNYSESRLETNYLVQFDDDRDADNDLAGAAFVQNHLAMQQIQMLKKQLKAMSPFESQRWPLEKSLEWYQSILKKKYLDAIRAKTLNSDLSFEKFMDQKAGEGIAKVRVDLIAPSRKPRSDEQTTYISYYKETFRIFWATPVIHFKLGTENCYREVSYFYDPKYLESETYKNRKRSELLISDYKEGLGFKMTMISSSNAYSKRPTYSMRLNTVLSPDLNSDKIHCPIWSESERILKTDGRLQSNDFKNLTNLSEVLEVNQSLKDFFIGKGFFKNATATDSASNHEASNLADLPAVAADRLDILYIPIDISIKEDGDIVLQAFIDTGKDAPLPFTSLFLSPERDAKIEDGIFFKIPGKYF